MKYRTWILSAWTLVVWIPRLRNIWTADDLSVAGQTVRTLWSVVFVVFAVGLVWFDWRRPGSAWRAPWLAAFVIWAVGFWAVRGVQIALADHELGFIVVHTVLAVVSIGLAVICWPGRADSG